MSGFNDPLVSAGGSLVYPQIKSPNFSQVGQTGWAVLKDGSAFFFNITATGTIDASGGITVGGSPGSEIMLNPNANQAFDVTNAIAGFLQAVGQFITTDNNEVVSGAIGALLLGTGTATKMTTALTSAFGSTGAAILIESENDAGTDTPVITFGTVTTPDAGTTLVYTPIATLTPYAFLLYGGASGQTVVTKTSGSGTIPIPVGVSSVKGECWGAGAAGSSGGGGGGGGEYSAEPALAVTGGGTVSYVVGAGGTCVDDGTDNNFGTAGGNSTLTGSSATVTGHGGSGSSPFTFDGGLGGTGYTGTVHFDGGRGGFSQGILPQGGSGGGSSGGTSSAGNNGSSSFGNLGANGGAAVAGGGAGGAGGSSTPVAGHAGSAPGGAGGGSGSASDGNSEGGGAGANGQVRVTYSGTAPSILFSTASASGTDQFGTSYPAGIKLGTKLLTELAGDLTLDNISAPGTPTAGPDLFGHSGHLNYVSTDANVYDTGRLTLLSTSNPYNVTSTTPATIPGLSCPVVAGTYHVRVMLSCTQGGAAFGVGTQLTGPSTSGVQGFTRDIEEGTSITVNTKMHSSLPSSETGPAFTALANFTVEMDMLITFTASGTLACQAFEGTATHQWKVNVNSTMTVEPVVA